jgi:hypothetical protein
MFGELVRRSWYSDLLQAGQSRVKSLAGARNFLLSKTIQRSFGSHPGSYSMGTKVKNEWSYNSTLTMYLYSMDRDNFTLTFHIINRTVLPQPWKSVEQKKRPNLFMAKHMKILHMCLTNADV